MHSNNSLGKSDKAKKQEVNCTFRCSCYIRMAQQLCIVIVNIQLQTKCEGKTMLGPSNTKPIIIKADTQRSYWQCYAAKVSKS